MQIASDEISVIIQGAIAPEKVNPLIESVIKYLPKAEIIVSTWLDSKKKIDPKFQDQVKIIESEPIPDVYRDPISNVQDNLHRQVTTTLAGLKAATRKFSLKLRSDLLLESNLITQTEKLTNSPYFEYKISATNLGFVDPTKIPFLFHISDLALFGATRDLIQYWSFEGDYETHENFWNFVIGKLSANSTGFRCSRYSCEQRIVKNFLQRKGEKFTLQRLDSVNLHAIEVSEKFILSSFLLSDYKTSGVVFPKRIIQNKFNSNFYSPTEFNALAHSDYDKIFSARVRQIYLRKYVLWIVSPYFYKGLACIFAMPASVLLRKLGFEWTFFKK